VIIADNARSSFLTAYTRDHRSYTAEGEENKQVESTEGIKGDYQEA
jgi:hypothetical protein